ncbi:MAG: hypothetical protein SFX73_32010 [Kofleriaceae bacterium]|nr:hypothetical protein [Kofleriaceae bacterium]
MIRLGDKTLGVASASLEVFHLFAVEAGWVLEATLDDGSRVSFEGRVPTPVLPGPRDLALWYVDAPRVATVDGALGTLAADEPPAHLVCTALPGGRVHLAGTLELVWTSVADRTARRYPIEIAVDAALIT